MWIDFGARRSNGTRQVGLSLVTSHSSVLLLHRNIVLERIAGVLREGDVIDPGLSIRQLELTA